MKRIFTVILAVLAMTAVLCGCTENEGTQRSPGVDYPPDRQENLNNYNNGLS